jgi:hypothetical protein
LKKIFLLQELELNLEESIFLQGDQLVDYDKVLRLQEIERHLWVAEVEESQLFEVEIKISPSKVLAYTCDCDRFKSEGICQHIVAVLIKIRRKKNVAREKKAAKPKRKSTHKKLTTNIILEQVSNEELQAFVRQYAKTNRSFAIALKTRFASNVSSLDSKEKFSQLLESAINHNRKPDRSISMRGSQKILKVLAELQAQIEDAIALEHYHEAISIAQSIIEKTSPIIKKLSHNREIISDNITEAFDAFNKIAQLNRAPALREAIWNYCLEESDKIIYRASNVDHYFFKILLQLSESKEDGEILIQALEHQIAKYKKEQRPLSTILLTQINVLEKMGSKKDVKQLINDNLDQPDVLFFAIHQSLQKKDWKKAKLLAKEGMKMKSLKDERFKLEQILLQISRNEGNSKAIAKYARSIFLRTMEIGSYRLLKENFDQDWTEEYKKLVQQITALPFSERRRDIIASMHLEENDQNALLEYLQKTGSIDLLIGFDTSLFPEYKEELKELYQRLLTGYLKNHLGRKTSQRIRDCMQHLKEIGQDRLAEELVENFRSEYPERHTLMEELAYF